MARDKGAVDSLIDQMILPKQNSQKGFQTLIGKWGYLLSLFSPFKGVLPSGMPSSWHLGS